MYIRDDDRMELINLDYVKRVYLRQDNALTNIVAKMIDESVIVLARYTSMKEATEGFEDLARRLSVLTMSKK